MAEARHARARAWTAWLVALAGLAFPRAIVTFAPAAEPSADASIIGVVRDESGQAIMGTKVTAKREASATVFHSATDRKGAYAFNDLDPGTYVVTAESAGYKNPEPVLVILAAQERRVLDFSLRVAAPSKSGGVDAAAPGGFYDEPTFKSSPLTTSGEPAGYSSGSQGEVSHRLLEDMADLLAGRGSEETGKDIQRLLHPDSPRGDGASSVKEYEVAADREPTETNLFAWGDALLREHDYPTSEQVFKRAIEQHPASVRLHLGLGVAQYLRGDYGESLNSFILASNCDPSDTRPYVFLGRAYSGATGPESAEVMEILRRFVQLQPQNALAHYYYALGLWKGERRKDREGQWNEIEASLEHALSLRPELVEAHMLLGSLYEKREMIGGAIAQYQQAVKLEPRLPAAHYRLSKLYLRQGDKPRSDLELAAFEKLVRSH